MTRVRRPRTSTLVLIGLFLAVFALYVLVRPVSSAGGTTTGAGTNSRPATSPAHHLRPHRHRATPTPTVTRRHRATPSPSSASPTPSPSPSASPSPTLGATATPSPTLSASGAAAG